MPFIDDCERCNLKTRRETQAPNGALNQSHRVSMTSLTLIYQTQTQRKKKKHTATKTQIQTTMRTLSTRLAGKTWQAISPSATTV